MKGFVKDFLRGCPQAIVAGLSIGLFAILPGIVVYVLGALGIWK